jgi:hypothetical protein
MNPPDRLFCCIARPATRKQGACCPIIFRFHEELGECGMCHIRTPVVQTDFGVACEFESSFSSPAVFNSKRADFRVDIWCDADCPRCLDAPDATAELGPVAMEAMLMRVLGRENWLMANGPKRVVRKISNVAKLTPAIACCIFAPPSNVEILPGRPTGACRSE